MFVSAFSGSADLVMSEYSHKALLYLCFKQTYLLDS